MKFLKWIDLKLGELLFKAQCKLCGRPLGSASPEVRNKARILMSLSGSGQRVNGKVVIKSFDDLKQ